MSCEIQPARHNHQPTHQQGTKWASKAWQKCQFRAKFGRSWAKNPDFYWRNQKFCSSCICLTLLSWQACPKLDFIAPTYLWLSTSLVISPIMWHSNLTLQSYSHKMIFSLIKASSACCLTIILYLLIEHQVQFIQILPLCGWPIPSSSASKTF